MQGQPNVHGYGTQSLPDGFSIVYTKTTTTEISLAAKAAFKLNTTI
jgi:hypothetical protein